MQLLIEKYKTRKTSHIKNSEPELYQYLLDTTSFLTGVNISTTQRLWHHWNTIFHRPRCTHCNINDVNWDITSQQYRPYCSKACSAISTSHRKPKKLSVSRKCRMCDNFATENHECCSVKCNVSLQNIIVNDPMSIAEILEYITNHITVDYNYRKFRGQHSRCFVQIMKHTQHLPTTYQIAKRIKWLHGHIVTNQEINTAKILSMNSSANTVREAKATTRGNPICSVCGGPRNYIQKTNKYPKRCSTECENVYQAHRINLRDQLQAAKLMPRIPPNKNLSDQLNDKDWLTHMHLDNKLTKSQIAHILSVDKETITNRFKLFGIQAVRFPGTSAEREIYNIIKSSCPNTTVVCNTRDIIYPKELDIYLPDLGIAIEYCGLYWHSDIHNRISNSYHKDKMNRCAARNIRLLTIFEDEWIHKKQLVIDKILSIIGCSTHLKISARECVVRAVSTAEKIQFFDATHIQGNGPSSINIGLFYGKTLVSCIGLINNSPGTYTLNRFSSSCVVRGAFSKLMASFKNTYSDWNVINTFSDLRWSTGQIYVDNGFHIDKVLPPDYAYIDNIQLRRIHKFNYRRAHLSKKLKVFCPEKSEVANTRENGIFRIFDCGKIRFKLTK